MVNLDDKRREWLESISDLKKKKEKELEALETKKKKELEEFEQKKEKAIKEAEERLKASVEELAEEEQTIELKKRRSPEPEVIEENLEETVTREQVPEEVKEQGGPAYQIPIEETVATLYQSSDYNVYNELKTTLEKVQRGDYLTQEERHTFYKRQEQFQALDDNPNVDPLFLDNKDPYGYVDRSRQVIDSISKQLDSTYKR